jgi:hypothetical protein
MRARGGDRHLQLHVEHLLVPVELLGVGDGNKPDDADLGKYDPAAALPKQFRNPVQELTNFGDGGRQPGQFYGVHSIATDSKGNIYTTETYEGKRLQKFVHKGMGRLPPAQGTPWPRP